jgi:hypothetical protein
MPATGEQVVATHKKVLEFIVGWPQNVMVRCTIAAGECS